MYVHGKIGKIDVKIFTKIRLWKKNKTNQKYSKIA